MTMSSAKSMSFRILAIISPPSPMHNIGTSVRRQIYASGIHANAVQIPQGIHFHTFLLVLTAFSYHEHMCITW